MSRYPLGTSDEELERLRFQHEVWGPVTGAFLDRIGVQPGARCLDLGCGPGFVALELAERVGEAGTVVALDESPRWIAHVEREARERRVTNLRGLRSTVEAAPLEPGSFDLVFARWVFSFLPDPAAVVRRLAPALAPGGLLAVQDYNHEGISLFPGSEGFRAVVRATRELYARSRGDTWIAARMPGIMRAAGLQVREVRPTVICGGPGSPAFRWAGAFFPHFSGKMLAEGLLSPAERERFLAEWAERERDPDALFFSPIVVDVLARR